MTDLVIENPSVISEQNIFIERGNLKDLVGLTFCTIKPIKIDESAFWEIPPSFMTVRESVKQGEVLLQISCMGGVMTHICPEDLVVTYDNRTMSQIAVEL